MPAVTAVAAVSPCLRAGSTRKRLTRDGPGPSPWTAATARGLNAEVRRPCVKAMRPPSDIEGW
jgi:hypothetical protein